jgi:hypothetical protein
MIFEEFDMAAFWVVTPCRLVGVYRRFRGLYSLQQQGTTYFGGRLDVLVLRVAVHTAQGGVERG